MTSISYPNGAGQSLGDYLATTRPLQMSGDIWYVNSATGADAGGTRGKNAERPLATLNQAHANAANHDIIVLMDGHTEEMSFGLTVSKSVAIVGAGSSGGIPTANLTFNDNIGPMIAMTGAFAQIRNVRFKQSLQSCTDALITSTSTTPSIIGCRFERGQYDLGPALTFSSATVLATLTNCTFISTATSSSAQPESAIKLVGNVGVMRMTGVVFSGGTVGWSNPYAFDSGSYTVTRLEAEGLSLLLGADMKLASSTVGWCNIATCTGGSRLDW